MMQGSIVAIVTPMHEDGSLDLAAFRALIDFHIAQGTDGIVVVGTTGESPTVNVEEHELLIAEAVKHAAERIPIIAGTGANSTTKRSNWPPSRKGPARMRRCRWCLITTSRPRKVCTCISRPSPRRWTCRTYSTTCRGAPSPTWATTRCCAWRRSPTSSASRTRPATSSAAATCCSARLY